MQDRSDDLRPGAGGSLLSAVGLTLLGTSCCALPIMLVALGAGGAVASMASSLPWLVAFSEYKIATFGITALALGYAAWRLRPLGQADTCSLEDGKRLRRQRWVLRGATAVFAFSLFTSYALLPIVIWVDHQ